MKKIVIKPKKQVITVFKTYEQTVIMDYALTIQYSKGFVLSKDHIIVDDLGFDV